MRTAVEIQGTPVLLDHLREIEELTDVHCVWERVARALEPMGISFLNYLTVDEAFAHPFLLTTIPEIYADTDPARDPFLSHCCHSYEITRTGPEYLSDYAYLPDAAKGFIARARQTGFTTGLGIPMRLRGSPRFGGFNLGTRLNRATFESQVVPLAEEFRVYCLLVHRRIEELQATVSVQPSAPPPMPVAPAMIAPDVTELEELTPREREVAYLIGQGISRKECARICSISPHTVSDYLKAIYRKLGVNDRVALSRLVHPKVQG